MGCLLDGSMMGLMVTSSKRAYAISRSIAPEPLPLQQSTADLYLHRRHANTVMSHFLWGLWVPSSVQSLSHIHLFLPHGLQHARLPCPFSIPGACSNSCPSSRWCHPTISSSVVPFSSCLQSFPASGSFPMSQFFTSDGKNIGVSASTVLPMNIQG